MKIQFTHKLGFLTCVIFQRNYAKETPSRRDCLYGKNTTQLQDF
jgi:hypothetical protein